MPPLSTPLSRNLIATQIFAPSTNVGKTVFSTLLAFTLLRTHPGTPIHYLKPISTGQYVDSDFAHLTRYIPITHGVYAKTLWTHYDARSPHRVAGANPPSDAEFLALVRAHIAGIEATLARGARSDGGGSGNADDVAGARPGVGPNAMPSGQPDAASPRAWLLVETAGGVNSPTLCRTLQADLYRPLRLPVVLIGDHTLGGIGTTVSAFESLHVRGYDVVLVAMFKDKYHANHAFLKEYFGQHAIPLYAVQKPPQRREREPVHEDHRRMAHYYRKLSRQPPAQSLVRNLELRHRERIERLENLPRQASESLWWPFTQHRQLRDRDLLAIDSAHGDFYQTYSPPPPPADGSPPGTAAAGSPLLTPLFDASASWWTQGLGHGNHALTLAAAHAAGRYGHVILAGGTAHEPAVSLAKLLLGVLRNPRLRKVFYSDNGSTGVEVAVKMALRASRMRYGRPARDGREQAGLEVLGLRGSYHGDTIGAMDASEPGTFNKEVEWYRGRGFWFPTPLVGMKDGVWRVEVPDEMRAAAVGVEEKDVAMGGGLNEVFDLAARQGSRLARAYSEYILAELRRLRDANRRFGALLLEPVVLGAGGMLLVDPLFQHTLCDVVRSNPSLFSPTPSSSSSTPTSSSSTTFSSSTPPPPHDWSGLPVIFDEVFTGLYRLGHAAAGSLLQTQPDISVHAKLLTGGLLPLCCTVASEAFFAAFLADEKKDALLHGHSYTAHPVGCAVAVRSIKTLRKRMQELREAAKEGEEVGGEGEQAVERVVAAGETVVEGAQHAGAHGGENSAANELDEERDAENSAAATTTTTMDGVWCMWKSTFVARISRLPSVKSVWALGTVLAVHLQSASGTGGSGYASTAAESFVEKMRVQRRSPREGPRYAPPRFAPELPRARRLDAYGVHVRALGDVVYVMASLTTPVAVVRGLQTRVLRALGGEVGKADGGVVVGDGDGEEEEGEEEVMEVGGVGEVGGEKEEGAREVEEDEEDENEDEDEDEDEDDDEDEEEKDTRSEYRKELERMFPVREY